MPCSICRSSGHNKRRCDIIDKKSGVFKVLAQKLVEGAAFEVACNAVDAVFPPPDQSSECAVRCMNFMRSTVSSPCETGPEHDGRADCRIFAQPLYRKRDGLENTQVAGNCYGSAASANGSCAPKCTLIISRAGPFLRIFSCLFCVRNRLFPVIKYDSVSRLLLRTHATQHRCSGEQMTFAHVHVPCAFVMIFSSSSVSDSLFLVCLLCERVRIVYCKVGNSRSTITTTTVKSKHCTASVRMKNCKFLKVLRVQKGEKAV
jgi:hypothetical protein